MCATVAGWRSGPRKGRAMVEITVWGLIGVIFGAGIVGTIIGMFVTCLCVAAGQADENMERIAAQMSKERAA